MDKKYIFLVAAFLLTSCSSNQLKEQTPEEKKAEVFYTRGTQELIDKNYQAALTHLLDAKKFDPQNSKVRNNLGMAYFFRDQIELAEKELKESIALDKRNSDAKLNLGSLYLQKKNYKEAKKYFLEVEKDLTYTGQFRNYYNLAILSLVEGDRKTTFDYLKRSVTERDDYCTAHFKLGELYSQEYRFSEALTSFRNARKGTCVSDPAPLYHQALTLVQLNRTAEAKMALEEIITKHKDSKYEQLSKVQLTKLDLPSTQNIKTRSTQNEKIYESSTIETPTF